MSAIVIVKIPEKQLLQEKRGRHRHSECGTPPLTDEDILLHQTQMNASFVIAKSYQFLLEEPIHPNIIRCSHDFFEHNFDPRQKKVVSKPEGCRVYASTFELQWSIVGKRWWVLVSFCHGC
jgi:hypothetical protein